MGTGYIKISITFYLIDRIDCLQKEIEISGDLPQNLETLKAELDELEIAIGNLFSLAVLH